MSCVNERLMRALWTPRSLNGPVINTALICCWTPVKGFSKWGWIQAVWGKAEAKWPLISTGPERSISEFIPITETGSWDSYAFVFATALMLFQIIRLRVFWTRGMEDNESFLDVRPAYALTDATASPLSALTSSLDSWQLIKIIFYMALISLWIMEYEEMRRTSGKKC